MTCPSVNNIILFCMTCQYVTRGNHIQVCRDLSLLQLWYRGGWIITSVVFIIVLHDVILYYLRSCTMSYLHHSGVAWCHITSHQDPWRSWLPYFMRSLTIVGNDSRSKFLCNVSKALALFIRHNTSYYITSGVSRCHITSPQEFHVILHHLRSCTMSYYINSEVAWCHIA